MLECKILKACAAGLCLFAPFGAFAGAVEKFPLSDVRLLEGSDFYNAMQTDTAHILAHDTDRFIAPYLMEAGLPTAAPRYGGWESMGVSGQTGGHYLSALSMLYATTGNREALERANRIVDALEAAQEANGTGFIGSGDANKRVMQEFLDSRKKDSPHTHSFLGRYWVPWYTMHKIAKGLYDAYIYTGNEKAKDVLLKYCDWISDYSGRLSDEDMEELLSVEYGGMNEVLAQAAEIADKPADKKKYYAAAKRFSQKWLLRPMAEGRDILPGLHANTQIPKVVGFARIALMEEAKGKNETEYRKAADNFWDIVTSTQTLSTGGNSSDEHFVAPNDFSRFLDSICGMETCNSYNMLRLTELLFKNDPDARYADFFERTLYNAILPSQDAEHGGFAYLTPVRPGHYRVYSTLECQGWCCIGTGFENHLKYGKFIYAHTKNSLYVNLFIASELKWRERGVEVVQNTKFPCEQFSELAINAVDGAKFDGNFAIKIRKPWWVKADSLDISIDGKTESAKVGADGYVMLEREWKSGDKIRVGLPMQITAEPFKGVANFAAIMYGPVLLASPVKDEGGINFHWGEEGVNDHIARGRVLPVSNMPFINSTPESITRHVHEKPGGGLEFEIEKTSLFNSDGVVLKPFYKTHHTRYNMLFGMGGAHDYEKFLEKYEDKAAKAKLELQQRTLDSLTPGQQQPEVDHKMKTDNSRSGSAGDGRPWRDAFGFFEYELRGKADAPLVVYAEYFSGDRGGRDFTISVNGTAIAEESLQGGQSAGYYIKEYEIPEDIRRAADGVFKVRFEAKPGNVAGGIFELGLAKKK